MALHHHYLADFNRIAAAAEERCRETGETLSVEQVVRQFQLRGAENANSTFRREKTAMKAVLSARMEDGVWPRGTTMPLPVERSRDDQIAACLDHLGKRPTELRAAALEMLTAGIDNLREAGFEGSDEDLAAILTGRDTSRSAGRTEGRHQHVEITDADRDEIDILLRDNPVEKALKIESGTRSPQEVLSTLRLLLNVGWLTGIRPIELRGIRMLVPDAGSVTTETDRRLCREAPIAALEMGYLRTMENGIPPGTPAHDLGYHVGHAAELAGCPPVLSIENAKINEGEADPYRLFRHHILTGIPARDLQVLCVAACIGPLFTDDAKWKNMLTIMRRNLIRLRPNLDPRLRGMTLYSMRHSFVTRNLRILSRVEVAALMGHIGYKSTSSYGKRGRGGSSGGWTPTPDRSLVVQIQEAWGGTPQTDTPDYRQDSSAE